MYAGLILAAGQARRFGSDKRQALLPNGLTMLEHVIAQYTKVLDRLWVVLPPNDDWGPSVCRHHPVTVVESPLAHHGMGHSLATGVQAILDADTEQSLKGLIIGLADMPGINAEHVAQVLAALQASIGQLGSQALVVATHQGQDGHPRGMGRDHLVKLTQLSGDAGARSLLDWSRAERVELIGAAPLQDIDRPEDLQALLV